MWAPQQAQMQELHGNKGTVFSVWSVLRRYKQDKLGAGIWGWGPFRIPEEGERLALKAATKQQLVKTVADWEDLVCPNVICEVQYWVA
jgi:hypothetical protein